MTTTSASKPVTVEDVGSYTLAWEREQLKVTVTNVQMQPVSGEVTGIIKIETTAPGYKPTLYPAARFNFMADRSRSALVNTLTKQYGETFDWYGVVAYVVDEVVRRQTAGEPAYDLDVADDVQPPPVIMAPMLWKNMPTIIYGDRGSAKSTLALLFGQVIELPWSDNPYYSPGTWDFAVMWLSRLVTIGALRTLFS